MKRPFGDRVLAGLLLFLASALFMTSIMLGSAIAPGYSMNTNAISDLGTIPETALLFNTSLIVTGILVIASGLLLHRGHGRNSVTALFVLAGIGAIGAGAITLSTPGIHGLFALLAFVAFNVLAIACASLVKGPMRYLSLAVGVIGLLFLVLHFLGDANIADLYGPMGHGGSERMIVYPVILWLLGFGGYLMGRPETAPAQA